MIADTPKKIIMTAGGSASIRSTQGLRLAGAHRFILILNTQGGRKVNALEEQIVNHQFELAGLAIKWRDIPLDGLVEHRESVKKRKKKEWWNVYKFPNEDMYREWLSWSLDKLKEAGIKNPETTMEKIDMKWGMCYKWKEDANRGI